MYLEKEKPAKMKWLTQPMRAPSQSAICGLCPPFELPKNSLNTSCLRNCNLQQHCVETCLNFRRSLVCFYLTYWL